MALRKFMIKSTQIFSRRWSCLDSKKYKLCDLLIIFHVVAWWKNWIFCTPKGITRRRFVTSISFYLIQWETSQLINQELAKGIWRPIKVDNGSTSILHLFFADELFLFGKATKDQTRVIQNVLDAFHNVLGPKVGLEKSKMSISRKALCENARRL